MSVIVRDVSKRMGKNDVLRNVSIEVDPGTVVGLQGINGSGKTMLMRAVCGLIGGVKVYNKFSSGDPDTSKVAASWFGACIFLIVAATYMRSFILLFI